MVINLSLFVFYIILTHCAGILSDMCDGYWGPLAVMCVSCKFWVDTGILFMLVIYSWQEDSTCRSVCRITGEKELLVLSHLCFCVEHNYFKQTVLCLWYVICRIFTKVCQHMRIFVKTGQNMKTQDVYVLLLWLVCMIETDYLHCKVCYGVEETAFVIGRNCSLWGSSWCWSNSLTAQYGLLQMSSFVV
jgi:hypothetical protein